MFVKRELSTRFTPRRRLSRRRQCADSNFAKPSQGRRADLEAADHLGPLADETAEALKADLTCLNEPDDVAERSTQFRLFPDALTGREMR